MEALVKYKPGVGNVALQDMPHPTVASDQVLFKIHCCGICGTDLHVYHDTFRNYPPVILGHEFSGTVVETGSRVDSVLVGQAFAVLGAIAVTCGTCTYCLNGNFMFCNNRRGMGHGVHGAFTSYAAVRPDQLFRLDGVPLREGALTEPFAVAVHAVCEIAKIRFGDTVLLAGPGPIGLLCLKLLSAQGIKTIVAGTSQDEFRLAKAIQFGAHRTVVVDQENLPAIVADETGGRGVDIAFECAGSESSAIQCLRAVRPMGQYVQVGHFGKNLSLPWDLVAFRQLEVTGSVGYTRDTWHRAIRILQQGDVKLDDVITHELPLSNWEDGFQLSENKQAIKVLLYPAHTNHSVTP